MRIDAIAIGENPPDDVNVIIEVPVGGQPIKYELDKSSGLLRVDRMLQTSSSPPTPWVRWSRTVTTSSWCPPSSTASSMAELGRLGARYGSVPTA